jgi:hypothetical protein
MVRGYRGHFTFREGAITLHGRDATIEAPQARRTVIMDIPPSTISVHCLITHSYFNNADRLYSLEFLSESDSTGEESERPLVMDQARAARLKCELDLIEETFGGDDRAYFERMIDEDLAAASLGHPRDERQFAGVSLIRLADVLAALSSELAGSHFLNFAASRRDAWEVLRMVQAAATMASWLSGHPGRPELVLLPTAPEEGDPRSIVNPTWRLAHIPAESRVNRQVLALCTRCSPRIPVARLDDGLGWATSTNFRLIPMTAIVLAGPDGYRDMPPIYVGRCSDCGTNYAG